MKLYPTAAPKHTAGDVSLVAEYPDFEELDYLQKDILEANYEKRQVGETTDPETGEEIPVYDYSAREKERAMQTAYDIAWEDFINAFQALLDKINPGGMKHWHADGWNLDWRGRSGEREIETNDATEVLRKVSPKTDDCTYQIYTDETDKEAPIRIIIYHHDVPTGSVIDLGLVDEPEEEFEASLRKAKKKVRLQGDKACRQCGQEMHAGDTVFERKGEHFCSKECLKDFKRGTKGDEAEGEVAESRPGDPLPVPASEYEDGNGKVLAFAMNEPTFADFRGWPSLIEDDMGTSYYKSGWDSDSGQVYYRQSRGKGESTFTSTAREKKGWPKLATGSYEDILDALKRGKPGVQDPEALAACIFRRNTGHWPGEQATRTAKKKRGTVPPARTPEDPPAMPSGGVPTPPPLAPVYKEPGWFWLPTNPKLQVFLIDDEPAYVSDLGMDFHDVDSDTILQEIRKIFGPQYTLGDWAEDPRYNGWSAVEIKSAAAPKEVGPHE
jgi:hypothetical protein